MQVEQSFEVTAPLERVWEALIDVERVAPCLPGAAVTGSNDDGSVDGEFTVKLGPTSANYAGKLSLETVDADGHTVTMRAAGTDRRGQGGAKATIVSTVADAGEGATRVAVTSDYQITGRLARFGRGGMIEEISERLVGEFSVNLQALLAGGSPVAADVAGPGIESAAEQATEDADEQAAEQQAAGAHGADEQATEQPVVPPPPPPYVPVTEPDASGALAGGSALRRVRENPAPFAALVLGFLFALRVLRRRD